MDPVRNATCTPQPICPCHAPTHLNDIAKGGVDEAPDDGAVPQSHVLRHVPEDERQRHQRNEVLRNPATQGLQESGQARKRWQLVLINSPSLVKGRTCKAGSLVARFSAGCRDRMHMRACGW